MTYEEALEIVLECAKHFAEFNSDSSQDNSQIYEAIDIVRAATSGVESDE